ncbi:MAG: right-handed parallel beta-helix repeat-containing protein, partial [Vicinamibacteraceae bacterium]
PKPAAGARIKQANPVTLAAVEASAAPGDIILLTPGYYGDFTATRDGEPGRPIVISGDTDHILKSIFASVSLRGRRHVIVEKLTVNGTVDLLGAEEIAVRHCRVNARHGIVATRAPGCKNCYIADNTVTYIMPWAAEGMGSGSVWGGPANVGEGIQITGPGNVICHNRVTGYRDGISTMEDRSVSEQVAIDIYNNDVDAGVDDCIEADFCMGNCRILRNRLTNCFMALSSQPSVGGPTYFVRNAMYNIVEAPFKLERGSVANVFLHNTVVKVGDGFRVPHGPKEYSHTVFRNNLVIGGTGGGTYGKYDNGTGRAIYAPETDPTNDFDYNGVGTHGTPFSGRLGSLLFFTFAEMEQRLTHTTRVDMNVFDDVEFPDPPIPARDAPHLGLKRGRVAVDAGIRLPNVNDDFAGGAPDLGAYELDRPVPHYGPRPDGVDEGTSWRE